MRILFVCMLNSITAVRWVAQLRGTGWDVHVFPSTPGAPPHPEWRDVTMHDVGLWRPTGLHASVRVAGLWPWSKGAYRATRLRAHFGLDVAPARRLARTIRRLKPDVVHSLEMQHGGYLTGAARQYLGGTFPRWIYSSWGSDLYHFGRDPAHVPRIRAVLEACDGLMCDCRRDVGLAQELGFRGTALGVFPGGGGFPVADLLARRVPVSDRRTVAIKGYQNDNYGGRALVALQAVHRCADELRNHEIVVYGANNPVVRDVVSHIRAVSEVNIVAWERVPHAQVLALLARSRIHLALGTTDGTPNAMLEAMILGALPIQSDTISTAEWIDSGTNGLLVPPEDAVAAETALRQALVDDALIECAALANAKRAGDRLDRTRITVEVQQAYQRIAG